MSRHLPQLSIVIPALHALEPLEATLVSVLQNRPDDCEIVVVLDRPYDDPYDLRGEVRFAVLPAAAQLGTATPIGGALRHGVELSRGEIVHVLAVGVEVEEGWTEAALAHFGDNRVAAVAPVVVAVGDKECVCTAGVDYATGGARRRRGVATTTQSPASGGGDVLGPTLLAGFYRRDVLRRLPAPFDDRVTEALIDVDLALQIRAAGFRAVSEPRSVVYRGEAKLAEATPFAIARGAERVFWRNAASIGWLRSLAAHGFTVARELVAERSLGDIAAHLFGRLSASCEVIAHGRHRRALAALGKPGLAFTTTSTGDQIRIDAAHPRSTGAVKPPRTADQRRDGGSEQAA